MQLCCGLSEEEAAVHRIPKEGVRVFRYLNSSGCCAIPGVDDAADFQEVRQAMLAVNIDLQSQVCGPMAFSYRPSLVRGEKWS